MCSADRPPRSRRPPASLTRPGPQRPTPLVYSRLDKPGSPPQVEQFYVHQDFQGSIDKLSYGGAAAHSYTFDAFGKRRNPNWVNDYNLSELDVTNRWTRLGYTGHEQLDNVRLIHMNGRVQDPMWGRMLSPDPIVGDLEFPQSLNPYSYVRNNPLRYTDPTGYSENDGGWTIDICWGCGSGGSGSFVDLRPYISYQYSLARDYANQFSISSTFLTDDGSVKPEVLAFGGALGCSAVPLCGAGLDVAVIGDPDAALWEKGLSTVSLGAEAVCPSCPNAGPLILAAKTLGKEARAAENVAEGVADAAQASRSGQNAAKGPVVIGETMARVEQAAAKIPGSKILNDMPDF